MNHGKAWSRRIPPLVMGGVALALMMAVLPSSLHLPVTGPGGQAEVAPVPGQGNSQANLSALGLADSGTVGSGGAGANADGVVPSPPVESLLKALGANGLGTVAQQSHCVGNPPRQTEDPLSPPCVPFWSGDNGGKTAKGVTGNSITIVIDNIYGHDGFDYAKPAQANDDPYDATARVLLRYFQSRFQTYNRTVHLVSHYGPTGSSLWKSIDDAQKPFGLISLWARGDPFPTDVARSGTMFFDGVQRQSNPACQMTPERMAQNAPYAWCMAVDHRVNIAAFARYACAGLVGRPASVSTDATIKVKPRTFAIAAYRQSIAQPTIDAMKATCGVEPHFYAVPDCSCTDTTSAAKIQADGITTVIDAPETITNGAGQIRWFPEWAYSGGDMNAQYHQRASTSAGAKSLEWATAFGISNNWRWKARPYPYYYQAAQAVAAGYQPDGYQGSSIYYGLLMAFTAIQRAGAHLSSASAQKGLESFTAAYEPPFSPHGGYAPGNFNFLGDFMIVRWDPAGNPPDGDAGSGCLRLSDGGKRYLPGGPWPTDDKAAVDDQTQPCQADEVHQSDGQPDNNHN